MIKKWLGYVLMGIGSLMIVFGVFMLCIWFPYVMLSIGILMVVVGRSLRKRGLAFRLLAYFMTNPYYPTTKAYTDNCDDTFLPRCNILEIDKGNRREEKANEQNHDNKSYKQDSDVFNDTTPVTHIRHIVKQIIRSIQPRHSRTS